VTASVLILAGPPGVGKTTVAELLAARSDRAVHLESDLFFRAIRTGYAYAVLRAPVELCAERVAARDGGLIDPDVVDQLWNAFADLGPLTQHAIDVRSMEPDETADLLHRRVREGTLTA
jgi:tRNA uridine 5-carbamoylmethylation protein Kti12